MSYTEKVKLPHTELIVGRSGSGKTYYLLKQLESILKNNDLSNIYIICPTIDDNKAYKEWNPPMKEKVRYIGCHHDSVNIELNEIIEKCRKNKGDEDNIKNIIVLDDCAQGNNVKGRTSPLVTLAFSARHIGIGVIVITQQLTSISKPYRDNLTRIVTFYIPSAQGTKLLYNEFMGDVSKEECREIQQTLKRNRYSYLALNLCFPYTYNIVK